MPDLDNYESLKALLKDNLEQSAQMAADIKKIRSYIRWQKIYSLLTVLLIVVPIVLGFLYLPPVIRGLLDTYRSALYPQ